jgi:hypothetical protein
VRIFLLSLFLPLFVVSVVGQDLTDVKYFPKLKGVKSYTFDAKQKAYSCLLTTGVFLKVRYNVVADGEYNGTYIFLKSLEQPVKRTDLSNLLFANLKAYMGVLPFSILEQREIVNAVERAKSDLQKKSALVDLSLKGYDESMILIDYSEELHLFRCEFFFRRLL